MKRSGNSRDNPDLLSPKSKKQKLQTPAPRNVKRDTKTALNEEAEETAELDQTFVVFDLETTGLKNPHITQISAVSLHSEESFNCYVLPKKPIEPTAQALTGLRLTRATLLELHGRTVQSVTITEALERFLKWLRKFRNVVLVAHYGRKFDFPVLLLAARNTGLGHRLETRVHGCVDTWEVFRQRFPGLSSYTQVALVLAFLRQRYTAHNGETDVAYLKKLINNKIPDTDCLVDSCFPLSGINVQSVM